MHVLSMSRRTSNSTASLDAALEAERLRSATKRLVVQNGPHFERQVYCAFGRVLCVTRLALPPLTASGESSAGVTVQLVAGITDRGYLVLWDEDNDHTGTCSPFDWLFEGRRSRVYCRATLCVLWQWWTLRLCYPIAHVWPLSFHCSPLTRRRRRHNSTRSACSACLQRSVLISRRSCHRRNSRITSLQVAQCTLHSARMQCNGDGFVTLMGCVVCCVAVK